MASKKAYLEHLRNVSLFQGCSTKDLEKIARASDEIKMPAGSLIVDQGQTGREAFIVLSGSVLVKRNNKKVGSFGPGTVVGPPNNLNPMCSLKLQVINLIKVAIVALV